jgi:tetratricopeptide (TPR) repeat protein
MSIRLCIIARDEAERIAPLAEAVDGLITSAYVLIDDRTTDETREACEEAWGELLTVELGEFTDFAQFRNLALSRARDGLADGDYLLLLDPDSLPHGGLDPDSLSEPAYSCTWRYHGAEWSRVILLRADQHAIYEGAAHEVLDVVGTDLPDLWVDAVVSADRERLASIAAALRHDAATNPRSAFYLAQTLRDLGRPDEAFGWYMRRAAMGAGWAEETYMATYEAACLIEVYDYELAATLWRRCLTICRRSEALYQLARQANQRGYHGEALAWASQALQLGPSACTLFVNRWVETEGISQQFNVAAHALLPQPEPTAELPVLQT